MDLPEELAHIAADIAVLADPGRITGVWRAGVRVKGSATDGDRTDGGD